MPKYILIGLAIPIIIFFTMNFWSKLSEKNRNRVLLIIFGVFLVSIFILLFLLMN